MDCCGDYDNNVEITNAIATFNPISFDGITINAFQEGAFVCIDNLGTTDESNVFWFATESATWFGSINTSRNIINNKIRYTDPDGKCYEGELNASPPNGQFNILTEV